MTANYKESNITGTRWTRCFHVGCRNPFDGEKTIEFSEEDAIASGDDTLFAQTGSRIVEALVDPAEAFDLIHPETGEVIGSSTYAAAYVLLQSLYLHCAGKRDAALDAAVDDPPEVELP